MQSHRSRGPIERFAADLFDHWGIGFPDYNYGILLLIAKEDRKARIELGADWSREHDQVCQRIMDEIIIPRFKRGDFSGGIRQGVESLDNLARGQSVAFPNWTERAGGFFVRALRFIGENFMAVVFFPLLLLGRILFPNRFPSKSPGSFWGGGSFGGGFSGGGGASGSW